MSTRQRKGFSLLELLITLVVLAFLVTLADYGLPMAARAGDMESQRAAFLRRELRTHRAQALKSGRKQVWYSIESERLIEFCALPDGRVISSETGAVEMFSGDLIAP